MWYEFLDGKFLSVVFTKVKVQRRLLWIPFCRSASWKTIWISMRPRNSASSTLSSPEEVWWPQVGLVSTR